MVAHVQAFEAAEPHVRQIDPWRDGRAVANLLESAFRDEMIDESGMRMLNQLRNYGVFEALTFGFGTGFVWVEDGDVVGNASVQRNLTRRDVWMVGNVATRLDLRNRGIGRGVVEACIQHAVVRGARIVALQADATNRPALHLYEKLGFERVGEVTHYTRPNSRQISTLDELSTPVRKARWSDRDEVWALTRANVPDDLTLAESFDRDLYRLGLRWSISNTLNGNPEAWFVLPNGTSRDELAGAVRTRANLEGSSHHLELLLGKRADAEAGAALIERGLARLEQYVRKPVYAAQARLHEATHAAMQTAGFAPVRTLVHMKLVVSR